MCSVAHCNVIFTHLADEISYTKRVQ
jgi:hypothetical protein